MELKFSPLNTGGSSSGSSNSVIKIDSLVDVFNGTTTKRDLTSEEVALLNTINESTICIQARMDAATGSTPTSETTMLTWFNLYIDNIMIMNGSVGMLNISNVSSSFAIMQKDDGSGYEIMNITES